MAYRRGSAPGRTSYSHQQQQQPERHGLNDEEDIASAQQQATQPVERIHR